MWTLAHTFPDPTPTPLHHNPLQARVFRMLSVVEMWILAVSVFVALYAHYLQVGGRRVVGGSGGLGAFVRLLGSTWQRTCSSCVTLYAHDLRVWVADMWPMQALWDILACC